MLHVEKHNFLSECEVKEAKREKLHLKTPYCDVKGKILELNKPPNSDSKIFFLFFFLIYLFSRELCEESMNHSASSASSLDSHAPSESSSQSQGMRWEEQQKLLALEQLCGVFRVDLGHMRSLRLFFRSVGECKRSEKGREGSLCCATA